MQRLLVHVEGQTEESFVNRAIRPHLVSGFGYADVSARLLGNARQRAKRGGIKPWDSVRKEIARHLQSDRGVLATTMVDYYGLPSTWLGRLESTQAPFTEKAAIVERELHENIARALGGGASDRFIPFVVMHEYEGLLFSDPPGFAQAIGRPELAGDFHAIRSEFATPEEINDSPDTAPSKRVERLIPGYQKPLAGVQAAVDIGLDAIRRECPHFDEWVRRLEEAGRG